MVPAASPYYCEGSELVEAPVRKDETWLPPGCR